MPEDVLHGLAVRDKTLIVEARQRPVPASAVARAVDTCERAAGARAAAGSSLASPGQTPPAWMMTAVALSPPGSTSGTHADLSACT